jgi:hypothetical protein
MYYYHHNIDIVFCSYCSAIINTYHTNKLKCNLCNNTLDLIIICFLCNNTYNVYYANEYCKYYLYFIKKIQKWYKHYRLKKNLIKYSNILLDKYYNPESKYIEYIVNNFDNPKQYDKKYIAYINDKNKLLLFTIY